MTLKKITFPKNILHNFSKSHNVASYNRSDCNKIVRNFYILSVTKKPAEVLVETGSVYKNECFLLNLNYISFRNNSTINFLGIKMFTEHHMHNANQQQTINEEENT